MTDPFHARKPALILVQIFLCCNELQAKDLPKICRPLKNGLKDFTATGGLADPVGLDLRPLETARADLVPARVILGVDGVDLGTQILGR